MKRSCRQAERWLMEQEADQLEEAGRIRLQEHLESCASCRQRGEGLSALVGLLRSDPAELRPDRLALSWQRVRARLTPAGAAAPMAAFRRRWVLVAGAATAVVLLALLAVRFLAPRTAPRQPALAGGRSGGPGRVPGAVVPLMRWQVLLASKLHVDQALTSAGQMILPGERIECAHQGRAILASPAEVVIIEGGSAFTMAVDGAGARRLQLERGALHVATRAGGASNELIVRVGAWTVRPLGTLFSVAVEPGATPPQVSVAEGQVRLQGNRAQQTVLIPAGNTYRGRQRLRPLPARAIAELQEQRRAALSFAAAAGAAATIQIEAPDTGTLFIGDLSVGSGSVSAIVPSGTYHLALRSAGAPPALRLLERRVQIESGEDLRVELAPAPAGPSRSPRRRTVARDRRPRVPTDPPASTLTLREEIRAVERLLRQGQSLQARQAAEGLLLRARQRRAARTYAPELETLIAESFVQEKQYQAAAAHFLRIHHRFPRSSYSAHGLYMAGSLELEQLGRHAAARQHFWRYLTLYRKGRLREGAHYLLWRALRRLGLAAEAQARARRYAAEFPRGHYLHLMLRSE